jgi:hypothetical protein
MTDIQISALNVIHAADDAGLTELRSHNYAKYPVVDLARRVENGVVYFGAEDVVAFREQIVKHQRELASERKHGAAERARAPLDQSAPETLEEARFRDAAEATAQRAAFRASPEGRQERIIELLSEIRDRLPEKAAK